MSTTSRTRSRAGGRPCMRQSASKIFITSFLLFIVLISDIPTLSPQLTVSAQDTTEVISQSDDVNNKNNNNKQVDDESPPLRTRQQVHGIHAQDLEYDEEEHEELIGTSNSADASDGYGESGNGMVGDEMDPQFVEEDALHDDANVVFSPEAIGMTDSGHLPNPNADSVSFPDLVDDKSSSQPSPATANNNEAATVNAPTTKAVNPKTAENTTPKSSSATATAAAGRVQAAAKRLQDEMIANESDEFQSIGGEEFLDDFSEKLEAVNPNVQDADDEFEFGDTLNGLELNQDTINDPMVQNDLMQRVQTIKANLEASGKVAEFEKIIGKLLATRGIEVSFVTPQQEAQALAAVDEFESPTVAHDDNSRPYGFLLSGWTNPYADDDVSTSADSSAIVENTNQEQLSQGNPQVDPSLCPLASSLREAERVMTSDPSVARLTLEALLEEASKKGASGRTRGSALAALAWMYEIGVGQVEPNRTHAVELYKQAANLGNSTAQFRMGTLHASGALGVVQDSVLMTLNYQFSALGGHTPAQLALGYRYMTGIDVPKSCSKAALYYELAANTAVDLLESHEGPPGVSDQHRLTNRVKKHRGGDDEEVFDYYRHAADKGDVGAQVALGQLYYYGPRGVERDLSMARRYFAVAAAKGDAVAQTNLGFMQVRGLGGSLDLDGAYSNFSAAALTGNAGAYNGLGFMYLYGVGVEADSPQAISLFNSAADQGLAEALYNLGSLYVSGVAVPKRDYTKAIHYFALGAQKGHTLSMHKLAQINLNGIGTHVSCDTAVMLFKSVAERGPWVSVLNDANVMYQNLNLEGALHSYLIAAEQGYEVAQSNAAYLLDSGVKLKGDQDETEEEEEQVDDSGEVRMSQAGEDGLVGLSEGAESIHADGSAGGSGEVAGGEHQQQDVWDWLIESTREYLQVPVGVGLGMHLTKALQAVMHDVLGTPFHLPIGSVHALRLYEYAAEQGNIVARLKIGDYFFYGIGGVDKKDYMQAVFHYRLASDSRDPQAMFNLGYMYENGLGLPQDFHLAKRFYDMAASASADAVIPTKLALAKLYAHKVYQLAWFGHDIKELPDGVAAVARWVYMLRLGYLGDDAMRQAGGVVMWNVIRDGSGGGGVEHRDENEFVDDSLNVVAGSNVNERGGVDDDLLKRGGEDRADVGDGRRGFRLRYDSTDGFDFEGDTALLMFLSFSLVAVLFLRWRRANY